jgi:hypothetical protein
MSFAGWSFANAAAWWGLLVLPALVAVHFFQQRARRVETSTRFLLDALAPESAGGRTWERFRGSRSFWLQALAALLVVWVWVEPRRPREDSRQTVVIVLDDALAMQAVEGEARAAAAGLMTEAEGGAARTEWVVTGSDPRAPVRYRGPERARAEATLAAWRPTLGTHDYEAALRGARGLAGEGGRSWFVTDKEAKVPRDQAAVGVGRPLANAGFAGGVVERAEDGGWRWRAVVKNASDETQLRQWWIEGEAGASERRTLELPPEGVVELTGGWPAGAERATLRLEADGFGADDALPLVKPVWKRLGAQVTAGGEAGEFFRRVLGGVEGVEVGAGEVGLRVTEEDGAAVTSPGAAVVLAAAGAGKGKGLSRAPVVAERHALVEGLNWQGLLGPGAAGLEMAAGDEGLLWQADAPLAWLRAGAEGRRQLVLNLDWTAGNAGRLPATVLLARRYAESVRDEQAGAYAANFDAGARVALAETDLAAGGEWTLTTAAGGRTVVEAAELAVLRAPAEAGFFEVRRGEEILVRGAAQFADARQGDFRGAGRFRRDAPAGEAAAAAARNTQGDPLAAWWLALAGAALVGSWWPGRKREMNWPQKGAEGAKNRKGAVRI